MTKHKKAISAWKKRDIEKVRQRERLDRELGRPPYWNKRAKHINRIAKDRYGLTETVTGPQLQQAYEEMGKRCIYCGELLTPGQVYFDHIQSMKAGGRNNMDNIGPSCGVCNSSKGDDDVDIFLARVKTTHEPQRLYDRFYGQQVTA
jgi:5-methylcytosine-specific restriction endonuclease McrA